MFTFAVARGILNTETRRALLAGGIPWDAAWSGELTHEDCDGVVNAIENEIGVHRGEMAEYRFGLPYDEDIAYGADILARLRDGRLGASAEASSRAGALLSEIERMYPGTAGYAYSNDSAPNPEATIEKRRSRNKREQPSVDWPVDLPLPGDGANEN
jgi:hypothetical protein